MELVVLTIAGVSSVIVLIVAFVLCAKKKTFTIEHSYDSRHAPNTAGPGRSAYRVRQVHQTPTGNIHKSGKDEIDSKLSTTEKGGIPARTGNNNVTLDLVKETPESRLKNGNGTTAVGSPTNPVVDTLKESNGKDVQRSLSKRKAPTVPPGSTASAKLSSPDSQRSSKKAAPIPPGGVSPVKQATKKADSHKQGKNNAAAATVVVTTPANSVKKQSSSGNSSPLKDSSPEKKVSIAPTNKTAPNKESVSNSLPRRTKSPESPKGAVDVDKSSTLPGRHSSKRRAPVMPGQTPQTSITAEQPKTAVEHPKEASAAVSPPDTVHVSSNANGDDGAANVRHSRSVLDRLPSIPKIDLGDSSLIDNQPDPNPSSVSLSSDNVNGAADNVNGDMVEEDPYAVIRNRKPNEEEPDDASDGPTTLHEEITEGGVLEPPYTKIKRRKEDDKTQESSQVENCEHGNSGVSLQEDVRKDKTEEQANVITDVIAIGDVVLVPEPDGTPLSAESDDSGKVEPPYAKVIKRKKGNRANIRVHFKPEGPEEIQPKKPPTPSALVTMNGGMMDVDDATDKAKEDSMDIIPEGPDYI